jgi:hypothetical protein
MRQAAVAPLAASSAPPSGWIANAEYDALFFVGSLLAGVVLTTIALVQPALGIPATIVAGIVLNNTHNLITGFYYFDPQNLAYYRKFPHYYFTMPIVLMLSAMGIFVYSPALGFTLHFFFTVWHVARQSVGVQKLYLGRVRAADFDRRLDAVLIYGAIAALHVFAISKFLPLWKTTALAASEVNHAGTGLTAGLIGVLALILVARVAWLGMREGRVAWQRLGFGLTSIVMYAPYLIVDQYYVAFMAGIVPHYVQYHGIFWLVGQNKYADNPQYAGTLVGRLARDLRVWFLLTVAAASVMAIFRAPYFIAEHAPHVLEVYRTPILLSLGFFYGIGWMHFYLDGLLFRFRYPEVRAAILRFLVDPRRRVRAAA